MKKALIALAVAAVLVATFALPVFAATGDSVADIMKDGFDNLKTELLPIIGIALAAGLGIFAIFFGVRKGISLLRKVSGG